MLTQTYWSGVKGEGTYTLQFILDSQAFLKESPYSYSVKEEPGPQVLLDSDNGTRWFGVSPILPQDMTTGELTCAWCLCDASTGDTASTSYFKIAPDPDSTAQILAATASAVSASDHLLAYVEITGDAETWAGVKNLTFGNYTRGYTYDDAQEAWDENYSSRHDPVYPIDEEIVESGPQLLYTEPEPDNCRVTGLVAVGPLPPMGIKAAYQTFRECVYLEEFFEGWEPFGSYFPNTAPTKRAMKEGDSIFRNNVRNIEFFRGLFQNCESLSAEMVEKYPPFCKGTKAYDFTSVFHSCTSWTYVPKNLFTNCTEMESCETALKDLYEVTTVPETLLDNCPKLWCVRALFQEDEKLESVPEDLFANNPEILNFYQLCENCTALTDIGESSPISSITGSALFNHASKAHNLGSALASTILSSPSGRTSYFIDLSNVDGVTNAVGFAKNTSRLSVYINSGTATFNSITTQETGLLGYEYN